MKFATRRGRKSELRVSDWLSERAYCHLLAGAMAAAAERFVTSVPTFQGGGGGGGGTSVSEARIASRTSSSPSGSHCERSTSERRPEPRRISSRIHCRTIFRSGGGSAIASASSFGFIFFAFCFFGGGASAAGVSL